LIIGENWRDEANCKKLGPSIFFSENEDGALSRKNDNHAKRICNSCLVINECLTYALNQQIPFGIWGGHTSRERTSIIKKLKLADYTTISSEIVKQSLHMIAYKNKKQ
jgi:WhiB family redox-sensing transcriptional regulator